MDDLETRQIEMKVRMSQNTAKQRLDTAWKRTDIPELVGYTSYELHGVKVRKTIRLTQAHFGLLSSPLVYLFIEKGKVLYVGKSAHGLHRPTTPVHNANQARLRATTVELHICTTEAEAYLLETRLIRKHKPPFNHLRRPTDPC